ncbi:MAG: PPOX class F420-dependent oxidoreductase [Acidimicrobiales bacterium]
MTVVERIDRMMNRVYDRMRHRAAFELRADDAVTTDLSALRGHNYAVVVTFRRNGDAVPSPAWFGLDDDGRAYVGTMHDAGKVKRIRNDPKVLIAPATMRGKPKGPAILATGRVLPPEEWPHAEAALAAAYGLGRRLYERVLGLPEEKSTYVEITPASTS